MSEGYALDFVEMSANMECIDSFTNMESKLRVLSPEPLKSKDHTLNFDEIQYEKCEINIQR